MSRGDMVYICSHGIVHSAQESQQALDWFERLSVSQRPIGCVIQAWRARKVTTGNATSHQES